MAIKTREVWLNEAVDTHWRPIFKEAGIELPKKVRVSVGWPGGRGAKSNAIGQCWAPETVKDGVAAMFISPVVDDPIEALHVLAHELVHAAGNMNHRTPFAKVAKEIGLVKPWTATTPGPDLLKKIKAMARKLGKYDQSAISKTSRQTQPTRLIKVVCAKDGYTIRVTQKWIEVGFTTCPCGQEMELG